MVVLTKGSFKFVLYCVFVAFMLKLETLHMSLPKKLRKFIYQVVHLTVFFTILFFFLI